MKLERGPFVFTAIVIVGCLVVGVSAVVFFTADVPSLVVSVVLACGVASLLYGIIGGVTEAGFGFGPLKIGGSAAVLLGGVWLFDGLLDPQLVKIRAEADARRDEARQEQYSFDHERHTIPAEGWFAIGAIDGEPMEVQLIDPVTNSVEHIVRKPSAASLPLKLAEEEDNDRYLVMGDGAEQGLGYVSLRDVINAAGSSGGMTPGKVYGFKRLHLPRSEELAPDKPRQWGNKGPCLGKSLPLLLEVVHFADGFAKYDLTVCGAGEGEPPAHQSSLASGDGELVWLTIEGRRRAFLIAVVGANHQETPPWSTFLVVEMKQDN